MSLHRCHKSQALCCNLKSSFVYNPDHIGRPRAHIYLYCHLITMQWGKRFEWAIENYKGFSSTCGRAFGQVNEALCNPPIRFRGTARPLPAAQGLFLSVTLWSDGQENIGQVACCRNTCPGCNVKHSMSHRRKTMLLYLNLGGCLGEIQGSVSNPATIFVYTCHLITAARYTIWGLWGRWMRPCANLPPPPQNKNKNP